MCKNLTSPQASFLTWVAQLLQVKKKRLKTFLLNFQEKINKSYQSHSCGQKIGEDFRVFWVKETFQNINNEQQLKTMSVIVGRIFPFQVKNFRPLTHPISHEPFYSPWQKSRRQIASGEYQEWICISSSAQECSLDYNHVLSPASNCEVSEHEWDLVETYSSHYWQSVYKSRRAKLK